MRGAGGNAGEECDVVAIVAVGADGVGAGHNVAADGGTAGRGGRRGDTGIGSIVMPPEKCTSRRLRMVVK